MKLLLLADSTVGKQVLEYLLQSYPTDLCMVVTTTENGLYAAAISREIPCTVFRSEDELITLLRHQGIEPDLGMLAWWPRIIRTHLLRLPKYGFANLHPSLLPYNRGKHYNFWALVEGSPFGVTLHFADEGVDTGDIIAQEAIAYDWTDTGETLYRKAKDEIVHLFRNTYPMIRTLKIERHPQPVVAGSFHRASELEAACQIDLDRAYTARDLLNRLRARTFPGHPACSFVDGGVTYEVRIQIERREPVIQ